MILSEPEPGGGPRLHRHPSDEIWVIERGNLLICIHANPTISSEFLE